MDTNNLHSLYYEDVECLNRPVTKTEIESVIRTLPTNKSPGMEVVTADFYQTLKEKLILLLPKLFKTIERGDSSQTLYMELLSP